jgi:hypothetical protein
MTGSLRPSATPLNNVHLANIEHLLRVVSTLNIRRRDFVQNHYQEAGRQFDPTLAFLEALGWLAGDTAEVALTAAGTQAVNKLADHSAFKASLVSAIIASSHRRMVAGYLRQFKRVGRDIIYRPSLEIRLHESSIRNLLMELGVVSYRAADDHYLVEDLGIDLLVWSYAELSISKRQFQMKSTRNEEIGHAAELTVFAYERTRVGPTWESQIEHTSATRPFACYDIKSISVLDQSVVSRYIEVKAVPRSSYQFYWTASEVEAARILGSSYFLYLLPFGANGSFDLGDLLIVADPIQTVYENQASWDIEENIIVCRRRT